MKKILLLILVLLVIAGLWFLFRRTTTSIPTLPSYSTSTPSNVARPDISNATFTIENELVKFKDGISNIGKMETGEPSIATTLTNVIGYGDLNSDKKEDAAVLLVQTGGGSGEFVYMAAYVSGTVSSKGTNAIFVGDRIQPQSISIKNGVITLKYLDRKEDEPFSAEPSVSSSKSFIYRNGSLEETQ